MSMTPPSTILNPEMLRSLAKLATFVEEAVQAGNSCHEVERAMSSVSIWASLNIMPETAALAVCMTMAGTSSSWVYFSSDLAQLAAASTAATHRTCLMVAPLLDARNP